MVTSSEKTTTPASIPITRKGQGKKPFNAAIVGGGKTAYDLLEILERNVLSGLNIQILGVSDIDPQAPALALAKDKNLFTTTDFTELFDLPGLNFIIELTGSTKVRDKIIESVPSWISVIDHKGAKFLWDLIQMEIEKTEMEKAQQERQEKEKKYPQVILDSLPYRIMVVNMDMTIETVNRTFLRGFNLDYNQVLGKHCFQVKYGLDKPCEEYGEKCFLFQITKDSKSTPISRIKEFRDENGEQRFDVITIAPIYNDQGEIVQLVEASRDVTERLKLEHEVQKSNSFFQSVIQSTVDGIVVVDTKGNVLIFNRGMEQLTGYSAEEIINRGHLSSFYDIEVAKENMKKMRSDEYGPVGKLNPTSMTIKTKKGEEIPVTLSASIITINGEEVGSVGVFTDMREILQMRRELEEAHLQLVQSEKIASVGKMAAGVAHEINNPLSGVLMFAELLKEELKDKSPDHVEDVQEIIDQSLRCKKIVSELLEFSRESVGKVTSFSLESLIAKSLDLLINKSSFHDIEVIREIEPDMPQMVGDIGQLQQVFTNLFINAADAMKGKGKLRIVANYDSNTARFIIQISDTGPGIPAHLRDKIFDIFFTTKPVGEGTGLGLSISRNIIKLHGGEISFDCPPEGGTIFTIELPLEYGGQGEEEESVFVGMEES